MAKVNVEDLIKEYKREARKADKRLYALENLEYKDERFEGVLKYSYKAAQRDIASWGGVQRFGQKVPTTVNAAGEEVVNVQQLKAKLADVKRFNESKTSTKQGIIEMYMKRQQTIKEETGLDMSWEDAKVYYDEKIADKFDARYGYVTAKIAMGKIQDNIDDVRKQLEAYEQDKANNRIRTSYTTDAALNEYINEMLTLYKDDLMLIGVL